jgi:hypothetical protein
MRYDCNISLFTSVRVVCYLKCTAKCFMEYKHKTEISQTSLCVKIWPFLFLVIAVVLFLHSCLSLEA